MQYEAVIGAFLTPIIIFGLLGNVLSFLVWLRGSMRKTSTAKYLSGLAFVDGIVLLFPATELWVFLTWGYLLRDQNTFLCKLYTFLPYFGPQMSAWIVVFVTTERAISVWYPHRVRILSTPAKAYISMLILTLCVVFVNSPLFVGFSITRYRTDDSDNDGLIPGLETKYAVDSEDPRNNFTTMADETLFLKICIPREDSFIARFKSIWNFWIQFLFLFSIPFIIISACNLLIVLKVILRRRYHSATQTTDSPVFRGRKTRLIGPITARIIAVSLVHCLSSAPLTILVINRVSASQRGDYYLLRDVFNVLFYVNNGINFVLYCVLGSGFRRDLVRLLCHGSYRPRTTSQLSSV